MRMIREILRLHYSCGLSFKKISRALGCSRGSVAEYVHKAKAAGLSWPLPDDLDDDERLETRLFPWVRSGPPDRPQPDCSYIHEELRKKGVTRVQLWAEYREEHPDGYSLSQFCDIYSRWSKNLDLTMRQEYKAGHRAFSDFAGKTLPIVDPHTGEVRTAHLFVCALGASSFTFAKLFWSEDAEAWCSGHAAAFEYFGGCPEVVVPDNPKPVVTKTCRYEPEINPSFAHMANHYDVAVMPARPRRPQDKAVVEAAVGVATRWILAVLRKRTFFSLAEANAAVAELLEALNSRAFKKLPGSRRTQFEALDRPALKTLPLAPYEFARIRKAKVGIDYHIQFDEHFYSVPYQLRGETLEVRATADTIEVFHNSRRVASHVRAISKGRASTLKEHMPSSHRKYLDLTPEHLMKRGANVGPYTGELIETVLKLRQYPELGFKTCLGILRLEKEVGSDRLERASWRALRIRGYSYKSVKSILDAKLESEPLPEVPPQLSIVHSNIRGPISFRNDTTEGGKPC